MLVLDESVRNCHQEELPKSDEEIRVTAAASVSVRFGEGEKRDKWQADTKDGSDID